MPAGSDAPLSIGRSVGALFMVNLLLSLLLALVFLAIWKLVALVLDMIGVQPLPATPPRAGAVGLVALVCIVTGASMARHRSRVERRAVTMGSVARWSAASIAVSMIVPGVLVFACLLLILGFAGVI
jgi:hypothetical protein